jgi:RNA polymerase sigma-70 factor (ECF subfamily)
MRRAVVDDVHDIVAECFLVLWRRLAAAPVDDSDVLPWLIGVARHVLANDRRARLRREQLVRRLADLETEAGEDDESFRMHVQLVFESLFELDHDDRELLLLAAWEELSNREIAIVLGCSENAAAIRLHRVRRRLDGLVQSRETEPSPLAIQ